METVRIKKMTATFGKLKNSTLELDGGLNIITAPNESGKTTWCAFLNAMLYGIDTAERDKAGHLSVKSKYRPWDGGGMVGTLELESAGRDLTVQRTTKGASPMKNFIAVRTGTADFQRDMDSENAGEKLTHVPRSVFERTAFISRPDIRVNQTSELERKIAGIVSSGNENTSYTESAGLLGKWQRKLRYNKMGSLPAAEAELREARHDMELIESSAEDIAGLRNRMAREAKQIELMEQDLKIHEKLDARAQAKRVEEARKSAEAAEARVEELTAAITKNGHEMTREDINAIRESAAAVMPLKRVAQEAERTLWRAEKELVDATSRREASPLSGKNDGDVEADIAKGRELEGRAKDVKPPRVPLVVPIIICVLAAVGLVLSMGILAPMFGGSAAPEIFKLSGARILIALLMGALGLVLFFIKLPQKRTAADELRELLEGYGVASVDKLASLKAGYVMLLRDEEQKRSARDAAREAYESAGNAAQEAGRQAVEKIAAFMPEVTSGEAVIEALQETERHIEELTKAQFDATAARNVYETLLADFDPTTPVDDSYLPMPLRSREDTVTALERARAQLTEATRAFDLATGAQRTLGDPAVIEGRIEELKERIAGDQKRYSALTLAMDTLSEANSELQTRFSPEVSRLAGEYMSRLTDGKYERLYFDKGFDASAKEAVRPETRNVLSLSDGTGDEIYLSLRLAMCELILGGEDPCPIVLDDALANFDDARCQRALELLRELAEKRQIILFSCHSREARMMRGEKDVKVIEM